jgi:hypothetical protein
MAKGKRRWNPVCPHPWCDKGQHYTETAYFEAHVMDYSFDGCRLWPGSLDVHGYGLVAGQRVNRAVCWRWCGPPPDDTYQAAHFCHNPRCWAAEHLRWATPKENQADRKRLANTRRPR